ncbi:hypothetical protein P3T37_001555 [Kitasatospora sp. MAA4]|nr:hypothetical protein [Kitasatospora sp. MAA4]
MGAARSARQGAFVALPVAVTSEIRQCRPRGHGTVEVYDSVKEREQR